VFWSRASPPCLVRNPCLSLKHRLITAIRQRDKPTIITTVSCGVEAHSEGFRERQDLLRWIDDFTFMTVFHGILSCYVIAVLLSFHLRSSGWLNALLFEWVSWKISPKSHFALRTESSGAERSAWIVSMYDERVHTTTVTIQSNRPLSPVHCDCDEATFVHLTCEGTTIQSSVDVSSNAH
jgi:hypothetical protein